MTHILNQRKALLTTLVACAITAHFLVFDMILPQVPDATGLAKFIKFVLSGGVLYSLVVLGPLWLYDKFGWRILNPQYDLHGVWEVSLTEISPPKKEHISPSGFIAIQPFEKMLLKNSGHAVICHTPFRAHVQEASGFSEVIPSVGLATWTAEVICVELPGKVRVVFEASADGGDFSGRDSLVVRKRDWRGRPIELVGDAFHVVRHLDIVIKGTILYRRVLRDAKTSSSFNIRRRKRPNKTLDSASTSSDVTS